MSPEPKKRAARAPAGLISRVADACFWFGRYVERSESTARVLQATVHLGLDGELTPRQVWHPVVIVSGEEQAFLDKEGPDALADGERVQEYLVWDADAAVSLVRSIAAARENARTIRDVLSLEVWETVNELHLWMGSDAARARWASSHDDLYGRVRRSTQLALGLLRSTMLHDLAMDFIWLGVLLERVGQTARLLDVHHHALAEAGGAHQVVETALWLALLGACSGREPFMKANAGQVTGAGVAAFLVGEARFPRSIAYCVQSAYDRLCAIRPPGAAAGVPGGGAVARLGELAAWMKALGAKGADPGALHDQLTHVVDETSAICETIGRELLGYGPPPVAPPLTEP